MNGATDAAGIQPIASTIDDVQRTVDEISGKELAVGADVGIREHERVTVERQARRPGRRVPHGEEVDAGAAVRDASHVDPRLVDVVVTLDAIEQPPDIRHLARRPPFRTGPGARMDHDLSAAGNTVRQGPRRGIRRTGRFATDASVQRDSHRPRTRGIVISRNVDDVVERDAAVAGGQVDAARCAPRILPMTCETRQEVVIGRTSRDDPPRRRVTLFAGRRSPEVPHRDIEHRRH